MEREIDELESENWALNVINNRGRPENFHIDLPDNIAPSDLPGSSRQDDNISCKVILQNYQQLSQHIFYEEVDNESCQEPYCHDRLSAGSSRSWSPSSISGRRGRPFTRFRRYSYPIIAQDFAYPEADDELSDDEMDGLSNLLRLGLTTRDESPPTRAAPDPRQLALQQSSGYPMVSSGRYRMRYGSNHSIFSEERSPVRPRRRRIRHAVKRYRTNRSRSESPRASRKRRRSLPPIARRRIVDYTTSESDEEPMEEVSYIDRNIERNYPLRSRRSVRPIRTSRRRLSPSQNPHRRRRLSQRHPRSRLYRRLRRVNSGRITRRRF
ncbi:unnamed protein product [Cercopithifilaria johnstoni]|uniref:Uncharacterized protein n=1 Tax=Cercopithifilaria johnstoni TaxID=2874296 RepID=A0A8J2LZK6_9BILA|nr:unnamed protein product [Cercopithifilaria johnstoni]